MQLENPIPTNQFPNRSIGTATPVPVKNPSSLQIKIKSIIQLMLSYTFFAVKLPKSLTICLLQGSLLPLKGLLSEHFPPAIATPKILEPVILKQPTKQPESPQRSIVRLLLGAIGLTIGVAAIIYSVKYFVVSRNDSTNFAPLKPLLPPPPASSSPSVMTSSSSNMTGSWLPYALGSGLFLLGLTNYCLTNWGNVSDLIPDVIDAEIPVALDVEVVVTPEDVLKQALACISSGDCIDLELGDAYQILVTEGLEERCADEVSSFCQAVTNSAVPILARLQQPIRAYQYATQCLNKPTETCQQMIDHFIPELLNALKSSPDQCDQTYANIALLAKDAINSSSAINHGTLSFLAKVPSLLLTNSCHSSHRFFDLVDIAIQVVQKTLQRDNPSPMLDNAQTVSHQIERLLNTYCKSTESIEDCEMMVDHAKEKLYSICYRNQNPICSNIVTKEFNTALWNAMHYLELYRYGGFWGWAG